MTYDLVRLRRQAKDLRKDFETGIEQTLAAAECQVQAGVYPDPARLPAAYGNIIRDILHLPGKLDHIRALIALGLPYDAPDVQGVTPIKAAGWVGAPDVFGYFLSLRPDIGHVNAFGGTLLTTIIHRSENAPDRAARNHVGCARLVMEHGLALPKRAIRKAGDSAMAAFLRDWTARYPGQDVAHDIA